MTFNDVTSTNNTNTQIGFAGDDGIDLLNIGAGSLNVTGTTTVRNADGVAISVEGVGADVTFNLVDIDTTGLEAFIAGVAVTNTGALNVNGGTVANTGTHGFRIGWNHQPGRRGLAGSAGAGQCGCHSHGYVGRQFVRLPLYPADSELRSVEHVGVRGPRDP